MTNTPTPSSRPQGRPAAPPTASGIPANLGASRAQPSAPPTAQPSSRQPTARPAPAAAVATPGASRFSIVKGRQQRAQRIVIVGAGGVGKTTLAAHMPGRSLFADIERSSDELDVERATMTNPDGTSRSIETFAELRALAQSSAIDPYDNFITDTATKLQELALAHTLSTVPHEKGYPVSSIEGYGYGKGYKHLYDTFLLYLADLDRLVERGKNVVLICHDCTATVPNPAGDDFIRWEPHLQNSNLGPIRNRVIQWADHVLFVGFDVIAKDGKGKGGGTRTIWAHERPTHIAKSRSITEASFAYESPDDDTIWQLIFNPPQLEAGAA